jgi:hypothetical protein
VTTTINVLIDENGLLDKANLQRMANRKALDLVAERKKVEEVASEKLKEKRRSLNQDVNTGQPLPIANPPESSLSKVNNKIRIGKDPAANRTGRGSEEEAAVTWTFDYQELETVDPEIDQDFLFLGAFGNGSGTGAYRVSAILENPEGIDTRVVQTDDALTGRYIYVSEATPYSRLRLFSTEIPAARFNKFSIETPIEMSTFTIPGQPPWSPPPPPPNWDGEGTPIQPRPIFGYGGGNFFIMSIGIKQDASSDDYLGLFYIRFDNSASIEVGLDGVRRPDAINSTRELNAYSLGTELYDRDQISGQRADRGMAKLTYDGTTGEVAGYLNNSRILRIRTGIIIPRNSYIVDIDCEVFLGDSGIGEVPPRPKGRLKLGTVVVKFS